MPPLRERAEDITLLAKHFLHKHGARYRNRVADFDAAAMNVMESYDWPGNVRELDHVVERAVLMARGAFVEAADLGLRLVSDSSNLNSTVSSSANRLEEMSLEEVESFLIRKALARFDGNVGKAAEALGLSRSALYRRIQRYEL